MSQHLGGFYLRAEDQCKTAFILREGLYELESMPFGLSNVPATLQRLEQKLQDLTGKYLLHLPG